MGNMREEGTQKYIKRCLSSWNWQCRYDWLVEALEFYYEYNFYEVIINIDIRINKIWKLII